MIRLARAFGIAALLTFAASPAALDAPRLALDTVWAEIEAAALTGERFYAMLAAVERRVTFWHPSYR